MSQIGYVTCDNVTNNDTMMSEFTHHVEGMTKQEFPWQKRWLTPEVS